MSIAKLSNLKGITFSIVIITILFFSCTSMKGVIGIEPDYISPDSPSGRACAEQAWQVRHECENEALSEEKQCLERARVFADDIYQREMDQYERKEASCEEAYQRALREWEINYRNYQRCLQRYDDPFEQRKNCGRGHRKPDRYDFCGQIFKPDYDRIIYSHKNNCDKKRKEDERWCIKKFQHKWVNICGGRIK